MNFEERTGFGENKSEILIEEVGINMAHGVGF